MNNSTKEDKTYEADNKMAHLKAVKILERRRNRIANLPTLHT